MFACLAILFVATALRLSALELNPLHHDEGVNGFFLTNLVRNGVYHYDPQNYHGPTLYFITLVPAYFLEKIWQSGMTTFAIRFVPAAFGIATVWLTFSFRRYVGTLGTLAAAALLAVSPGMVYNSRYFIHEMLFVCFTLGVVVALVRFYETTKATYFLLAFASAALLFATKETAFISLVVLALAWATAWVILKYIKPGTRYEDVRADKKARAKARADARGGQSPDLSLDEIVARLGGAGRLLILSAMGMTIFVVVNLVLFSSFFTYAKGVGAAFEAYGIWTETGTSDFHKKSFETYLVWLLKEEAPILLLAVLGALWAVFGRARNFFAVFVAAWAFGLLAAYSLVPYKTPWLAINFVLPLALTAGYAVEMLARRTKRQPAFDEARIGSRAPAVAVAALAVAVCLAQTIVINFYQYDNDAYPYVYAHTRREFLQLVGETQRLARAAGTDKETPIALATSDYWPIPWYFRDYTHVGYHNDVAAFTEPLIIAKSDQETKLLSLVGNRYRRVGTFYPLRPGVDLVLYARRDIAAAEPESSR